MFDQSQDLFENLLLVSDLSSAKERLSIVDSSFGHLISFRKMLDTIATGDARDRGSPNLRRHVADLAFDMERHTRASAKLGIDAINELRDSGMLDYSIRRASDEVAAAVDTSKLIPNAIKQARGFFAGPQGGVDPKCFDEALRLFKDHKILPYSDQDKVAANFRLLDGKELRFRINPGPNPGTTGRVSANEFFAASEMSQVFKTVSPTWTVDDCHHRNQFVVGTAVADLDVYGAFTGALKNSNEMIYHYARRVDEIGTPYLTGRDPITGLLSGLAIVAAVLVIAGITIEIGCATEAFSGEICDYGFWLVFAGILLGGIVCVAAGACIGLLGLVSVAA